LFLNLSVYLKKFLSRHQSVHTYLHLHGSQFIYLSFACPKFDVKKIGSGDEASVESRGGVGAEDLVRHRVDLAAAPVDLDGFVGVAPQR